MAELCTSELAAPLSRSADPGQPEAESWYRIDVSARFRWTSKVNQNLHCASSWEAIRATSAGFSLRSGVFGDGSQDG
jgi:hypothetical protein